MKRGSLWCALLVILVSNPSPAKAESISIIQMAEYQSGYERSFFKHWIDADRDGCDARREVLLAEAVIKPTINGKCTLAGGSWYSAYDGKTITNSALLDIDHLVPLAEAWRSGAWAWTPEQRTEFANDITEPRTLIAVSATTNRAKGDSDPKEWLPAQGQCAYIESWVTVKIRYALTFDAAEVAAVKPFFEECKNLQISTRVLEGYSVTLHPVDPKYTTISLVAVREGSPRAEPVSIKQIRLYGRCDSAGALGRGANGERYQCKRTSKDSTLKWRR